MTRRVPVLGAQAADALGALHDLAPAAQCHGECIGGVFALAFHLAQHDAQGKRLASTASEWSRSIVSASGWRKKSALRAGSDIGKPPGNRIPIR
ncbi:MAG: hypothetical protein LC098_01990 [Burkholderiales bacterium]|nr:hypothetical protein [Burkholderiales bacterium]